MSKTPIGGPLRRDLEAALATDEFRKAFEELKTKDEVFGRYPTVEALVALCQPGAPDPEGRDRALGAILRALRGGNAIFPMLHLMFWRSLEALYRRLASRTWDAESLFERLQWEFLQVVTGHDPDRKPRKIDVHIFLNTKKRVLSWEQDELRQRRELKGIRMLAQSGRVILDENPIPPEELESFLLDLLQRGVLNPVRHEVVLETAVYRRLSVEAWARRRGMPRATAHSHMRLAFQAIRKHLQGGNA